MAGHLKSILVLTILGITYSHAATTQKPGTTPKVEFTEFLNGLKYDVRSLLREIRIPAISLKPATTSHHSFSMADQDLRNNSQEMNIRRVFSSSTGNEYVDTDKASETAVTNVKQLEIIVNKTGIDPYVSFDANGNPVDPGVMKVSDDRVADCPYDRANSLPCADPFKEPTGRCTNMMEGKKTWGMAGTPFGRILSARYEDGVGAKRVTGFSSGQPLKSAREVSTVVTTTRIVLNFDGFNAQIMQWGQYISHEFTQLAETEADAACCPDQIFAARNGENVTATPDQLAEIRKEIKRERGDICIQIEMENDPVHGEYVCMAQKRSKPAPVHDCSIGPRQQMNAITHVFDGSVVYGSSKAEQDALRNFTDGKMKTQTVNGRELPPADTSGCPAARQAANRCPFKAGDSRINQTPNLMSLHSVALNLHNKIAEKLKGINPHWDDERLFQETRKIISAVEANIHYYEYLPIIMGKAMVSKYGLDVYEGFNSSVDPSAMNEMAHAAMRFGHSTVSGFFGVTKDSGRRDFISLRENFFNNDLIYNDGFAQCIKGLQGDRPWIADRNVPTEMRDFLFAMKRDIISLNINRGRDHGLPSYLDYRRHYGLSVPTTFDELSATHSNPAVVEALRTVYASVEDIELYPAGVTEDHVADGLIGETFANIIGDSFTRLSTGDRMWFESPHSGFSQDQINTIRGYKYNAFLCEGSDLETVSSNAYHRIGFLGATEVQCSSLPGLNLTLWKEEPQSNPQCEWKVVSTSPCCLDEIEVTRECVGDAGCVCPGKAVIKEDCKCYGYDCFRDIVKRCEHRWRYTGKWN